MGEMADALNDEGLMQEAIDPCEVCEFGMFAKRSCDLKPRSKACYRRRGMKCL